MAYKLLHKGQAINSTDSDANLVSCNVEGLNAKNVNDALTESRLLIQDNYSNLSKIEQYESAFISELGELPSGYEIGSGAYNYYSKKGNIVTLCVDINVSVKSESSVFTLPSGFRPLRPIRKSGNTYPQNTSVNYFSVLQNGNVILFANNATVSSKIRFMDTLTFICADA